jgi:hypothetical protein
MALILNVLPYSAMDKEVTDLIIKIGKPVDGVGSFAVQLDWEEIVMITNLDIDSGDITRGKIRELYTSSPPPLNIWTYPMGHEIRFIFDKFILENVEISPYGLIVSNPSEMLESIKSRPESIGYIPKSWVTDDVQIIPLDPSTQESLRQPVLALADQVPEGAGWNFISCLQRSWEPEPE